ncbi:hypothetical protein PPERSA_10875 [Pseudocohnilembus persalinus]|uniref:40S ribosomal protein S25 n=1 Tax=Pseudocohnilembus persalinus TaxID=266149 RepID=A0A0V0R6T7_PSEPJ|nr:hypothetical protein PPERSA_10875 [Pseudocohnilembus persalinus]|eukprot:KRX10209.1 hypothetical protein PPERSA_10875 [Pseudocohnilembus persalinus]
MGKVPATGQKKTKAAIAKAAQAKKGGKKKWSKGRTKDKVDNATFLEAKTAENMMSQPHKVGALISVATVSEKWHVNGSVARRMIRSMHEKQLVKKIAQQGTQWIYAPAAEKKPAAEQAKVAAPTKKAAAAKK